MGDQSTARANPAHVAERHQQHPFSPKPHDLRKDSLVIVSRAYLADLSDGRNRPVAFDHGAYRLRDAPVHGDGINVPQLFDESHEERSCLSAVPIRASWLAMRASTIR